MTEQQRRLRILWNSNSPWSGSGYGMQTQELLPHIRDAGFPIAASNFFGQSAGRFILNDIMQYPVVNHTYGSDAMVLHGQDFKADVVMTLQDVWVLNPQDLQYVPHWVPVVPIDHDPVSKPVLDILRYAYRIVTISQFGQKQLASNGLSSTYIPHTVNTEVFTPMNTPERKQATGLPADCYLVGMVAANKDNPPRKAFQQALDAFKLFLEKVPKALIYIHANPEFPGGFNFKQYADVIGIGNKLLFPDPYQMQFKTSKEDMAMIYNSFDMLLAPSISEGFGIPIIEAQSCGVPVVTNNFTAMPELIREGVTGELCKVAYKAFSPQGSFMGIPDVDSIYEGMMKIFRADRGKMKDACRKWIVEHYDTKTVFREKWTPFLLNLEKELITS